VDGSTAPFGAEGSRAQAWALAPIAIGQVIRARWICYAAPLVCTAALATALLAWQRGLPGTLLLRLTLLAAALQAVTALVVVLVNYCELDLFAPVARGFASKLVDAAPFTPLRLLSVAILLALNVFFILALSWSGWLNVSSS
ncbi:MAG TPA: hypothetical protein VLV83_13160, partial [Acidobacteriota bacterium]|nr:hypothetical protein [Acidobacteriota bacterium]